MTQAPEHHPDYQRWQQARLPDPQQDMPDWGVVIWRGMCGRCPRCAVTPIFDGYLKVHPVCASCGAALGDMPADDAPPYVAMVVVLQILGVFVVLFYKGYYDPGFIMAAVLLVLLALICMAALRIAKGAIIGILLKLGMRRELPRKSP
jgi:uncharacterized protein (DUF983 family)